jgi:ribosomal protein S18 acetylase RimI-like enzyme
VPGPVIRRARPEDAPAIAGVLVEALGDKFRPAFGGHAARAMTAVVRHDLERRALAYWVAEREGQVVAAVHLALEQEPDPGFTARVASAAGWAVAVRATFVLGLLSHGRLRQDEAYVEELAVAASARRAGLGRALMVACEEEALRRGKSRLTLWVTGNNDAGLGLYRSLGYSVRRRRRWPFGRLLFGASSALFMEKALDRGAARPG